MKSLPSDVHAAKQRPKLQNNLSEMLMDYWESELASKIESREVSSPVVTNIRAR